MNWVEARKVRRIAAWVTEALEDIRGHVFAQLHFPCGLTPARRDPGQIRAFNIARAATRSGVVKPSV
jgi:hypothetical protein